MGKYLPAECSELVREILNMTQGLDNIFISRVKNILTQNPQYNLSIVTKKLNCLYFYSFIEVSINNITVLFTAKNINLLS